MAMRMVAALSFADLVQRMGEGLHDVKPVDGVTSTGGKAGFFTPGFDQDRG